MTSQPLPTAATVGQLDRQPIHRTLPKIGTVRTCERTRRRERLVRLGRVRILAATLRRVGERWWSCGSSSSGRRGAPRGLPIGARSDGVPRPASWGAPHRGHPDPASRVGVDVGVRWLATMATAEGVIERVPNPAPLARNLTVLRRRSRSLSRSQCGSNRCRRKERRRARLQAHLAALRRHGIPRLTTRLATPHGRIVGEGLDAAGRLRQKGIPGARARRRGPAEAALAELRRQLRYQTPWYGSEVVEADRCFASSRTCTAGGCLQDLGWAERWMCSECSGGWRQDESAATNPDARWLGGLEWDLHEAWKREPMGEPRGGVSPGSEGLGLGEPARVTPPGGLRRWVARGAPRQWRDPRHVLASQGRLAIPRATSPPPC